MPVPLAPHVTLGCDAQSHVESLVRAHSTPQAFVFHCRLILRTAAPDHPSNLQVAQALHCHRPTVGRWRRRISPATLLARPARDGTEQRVR